MSILDSRTSLYSGGISGHFVPIGTHITSVGLGPTQQGNSSVSHGSGSKCMVSVDKGKIRSQHRVVVSRESRV